MEESRSTPAASSTCDPVTTSAPETKKRDEVQLTDQTNLLPFKKVVAVFAGMSLCVVVSTLDSVIVATSLSTVSTTFNAGSVSSWVPSAYLLTSTSFQPLYGRFSDIFGRKAALSMAMGIFMFGNLLAGFSKSIIQLIVFRGIAGAGGGAILSMNQVVISDIVSLRERGKYQGIIGGVVAVGYAIGPLIGGALSQKVSWRWCFWITIPVSACAVAVVVLILPLKPVQGDMRRKLLAVDYIGAGLTLIACTLLILPLIWGGVTFPWKSAVVLAPLLCGFLVAVIFCFWEWKGARLPIVPMYIFRHTTVSGVFITMFINGIVFFSSLYYLPQYFQVVLGYSPIRAGVFLIPLMVTQVIASWLAGVLVSRTGRYSNIIHSGFAVWAIGCGCLSTITPSSHRALIVVFMLLTGVGAGQTFQTTTIAAQAAVSRRDMSVVTTFRSFIRLLGGTLSLAIGATIINNSLRSSMTTLSLPSSTISAVVNDPSLLSRLTSDPEAAALNISTSQAAYILAHGYTRGFRSVFLLNASLSAAAVVASVLMIKHKELMRGDEDALREKSAQETLMAEGAKTSAKEGHGKDVESQDHGKDKDVEKGNHVDDKKSTE